MVNSGLSGGLYIVYMYVYIYIYGWWFQPTPLKKYDFVNGKDDIAYNYYGK